MNEDESESQSGKPRIAPAEVMECRWCGETIKAAARVCRHCGHHQGRVIGFIQATNSRSLMALVLSAVAVLVSIFLPLYQFERMTEEQIERPRQEAIERVNADIDNLAAAILGLTRCNAASSDDDRWGCETHLTPISAAADKLARTREAEAEHFDQATDQALRRRVCPALSQAIELARELAGLFRVSYWDETWAKHVNRLRRQHAGACAR